MRARKASDLGLPAVVLALSMLLGACGADKPTGNTVMTVQPTAESGQVVGMSTCTTCHASEASVWLQGRHANTDAAGLASTGVPSFAYLDTLPDESTCLACHDPLGDGRTQLVAGLTGNTPRPVVGCESCHGGGSNHYGAKPIARTWAASSGTGTTLQSSEFNTCTGSCHLVFGADAAMVTTHQSYSLEMHAAVPGDSRMNYVSSGTPSAVYYVKKGDDAACTTCHDPHNSSADTGRDYAASAHGNPTAVAWIDHDWKDRAYLLCQRCHTATGFMNFAESLRTGTTYSAGQNDFSYLQQGMTTTLPGQNETLYCWACHTDYQGTLRNPGPVTINYSYNQYTAGATIYDTVLYTYPDESGSNICLACHTGRQIGETIKDLNQIGEPSFDFSASSLINDHHYTAGGTVFRTGCYMYDGRDYTNPVTYLHDKIGTSAAPNTGSNGPCVGCHMSRTQKHLFQPVDTTTGNVTGVITNVASPLCVTCHVGGDPLPMSAAMLENQKALLQAAKQALIAQLETRGFYYRGGLSPERDGTILRGTSLATGLASATSGTTTITGTGTTWSSAGIETNDYLTLAGGATYTISGVVSNTTITLTDPYPVTTANSTYIIKKSESVLVTNGSMTVTGTGTNWTSTGVVKGDYFRVDSDGTWYAIAKVNADDTITLSSTYKGPDAAVAPYTIIKNSRISNWLTGADADTTGSVSGKNNMGAALNIYYFDNEPGAFAHNRYYTKRILYDSIDWLDDNQMNYSVGATLNAACSVASPPSYCEKAMLYILPNGATGDSVERP